MLKKRAEPIIDYREKITFGELKQTEEFLTQMAEMIEIQNRVMLEYVKSCKSPALFAVAKMLYIYNQKKMEAITRGLKNVNEMVFKLLDFGADPKKNMGGEA